MGVIIGVIVSILIIAYIFRDDDDGNFSGGMM